MSKAIGTTLLALCAALIVASAVAVWNGSPIAQEGLNLTLLLAGTIGMLFGLVGGVFTVKPRVTFTPVNASFETFPLELFFRIHNAGLFVLTDVMCKLSDYHTEGSITAQPTVLYTHDPEGRLDRSQENETFAALPPGHGDTLDIRKMMPLLPQQPDSASVVVAVSFRQQFWPTRSTETYCYKLFKSADGNFHWSEVSAG